MSETFCEKATKMSSSLLDWKCKKKKKLYHHFPKGMTTLKKNSALIQLQKSNPIL